jgi:hypothetical protein
MVVFCGGTSDEVSRAVWVQQRGGIEGYNLSAPGFDAGYFCHGVQQSLDTHSVSTFQHAQTALATC